jgi:hypothetical protein
MQVMNTVTRVIKNDIVAVTAMVAGPIIKLILGASFIAACGGPWGLALLGLGLGCMLSYALYKQYQRHRIKQVQHQNSKNQQAAFFKLAEPQQPESPLQLKSDAALSLP